MESTVYPGATDELIDILKQKKLSIGKNFFVGYSPERENPGDKILLIKKPQKLLVDFQKIV